MYSNMASRQWFIEVKSNTVTHNTRLRHPYTDFKSRRTKFAATVDRINLCENFVPPSAAAVRRVAAPYKVHMRKIVQISQAEGISPPLTAVSEAR